MNTETVKSKNYKQNKKYIWALAELSDIFQVYMFVNELCEMYIYFRYNTYGFKKVG